MRTAVITLLIAAFALVGPHAVGLSDAGTAVAADFTGRIKRVKIKKKRVGSSFRVLVASQTNSDGDSPDAIEAVSVSFLEVGGPGPLQEVVTLPFGFEDVETGAPVFAGDLLFEDDAVGHTYLVQVDPLVGGVSLGAEVFAVTVEETGFPSVSLDILNVPNAAGEVVLLAGDTVQVRYAVRCDDPSDPEECAAQLALSDPRDRLRLQTARGDIDILSRSRRGRALEGSVSLRTRRSHVGQRPTVVYVGSADDVMHAVAGTPLAIVDNPATAELMERIALVEDAVQTNAAAIAALETRVDANTETLAALSGGLETLEDAVVDLAAQTHETQAGLDANSAAIAALTVRVSANEAETDANTGALTADGARRRAPVWERILQDEQDDLILEGVVKARVGGTGATFFEDTLASADASVTLRTGGNGGTFGLHIAQTVVNQIDGRRVTTTIRPLDGGAPISAPVTLERDGDTGSFSGTFSFAEGSIPDSPGTTVAGLYRADIAIPLADGTTWGPIVAFVQASPEPAPTFDLGTTSLVAVDDETYALRVDIAVPSGFDGADLRADVVSLTPEDGGSDPEQPEFPLELVAVSDGALSFETLVRFAEPDNVIDRQFRVAVDLTDADGAPVAHLVAFVGGVE